jgi:hypothetical protein
VFAGKIVTIFFVMMIVSGLFAAYYERRKNAALRNVFVIITLIEGIYFLLAGFNRSIVYSSFSEAKLILIGGILLYEPLAKVMNLCDQRELAVGFSPKHGFTHFL